MLACLVIHFDPLIILIGPIFYLYFKSLLTGKFVFEKWFWLYSIPVCLILINTFPYYVQNFETKIQFVHGLQLNHFAEMKIPGGTWLLDYNTQMKIIPIHNLIYIIYTFFYLLRLKNKYAKKAKISTIINRVFRIILFVISPMIIQIFLATIHSPSSFEISFQDSTISSDVIYLTSLILPVAFFLFPTWLYGNPTSKSIWEKINDMWLSIVQITKEHKIEKPEMSADLDRIIQYMEMKKPYLKNNFSAHDVSRELNIPHLRVSTCFNKQLEKTFPEYRNKLRVAYAVNLLQENAQSHMSIEGIAIQSGFKNKSSFYAAFRAVYQMTPTEWISKHLA